jgi:hypothetical protein
MKTNRWFVVKGLLHTPTPLASTTLRFSQNPLYTGPFVILKVKIILESTREKA